MTLDTNLDRNLLDSYRKVAKATGISFQKLVELALRNQLPKIQKLPAKIKSIILILLSAVVMSGSLQAQERKVADAKYWTAVGAAASVGLADAIQSKRIRTTPWQFEHNPLLGRDPSWPRVLGIGAAFHGSAAFAAYEMKKRGWRLWWLPQLVLVGAHVYGISTNHQRFCQRTNPTFPNFCH